MFLIVDVIALPAFLPGRLSRGLGNFPFSSKWYRRVEEVIVDVLRLINASGCFPVAPDRGESAPQSLVSVNLQFSDLACSLAHFPVVKVR